MSLKQTFVLTPTRSHAGFSHRCPCWPQIPQGSAEVQSQVCAGTPARPRREHSGGGPPPGRHPLPQSTLFSPPFALFLPPFALLLPALANKVGCKALRDEHFVRRYRCKPLENGGARASLSHSAAFCIIILIYLYFFCKFIAGIIVCGGKAGCSNSSAAPCGKVSRQLRTGR